MVSLRFDLLRLISPGIQKEVPITNFIYSSSAISPRLETGARSLTVNFNVVAPALLGSVHRLVGVIDEALHIPNVRGHDR